MSSHHNQERMLRSSTFAAVLGVGLVISGVVWSLLQGRGDAVSSAATVGNADVDGGVLSGLGHVAPTLAGILLTVIVVAFVLMYRSRPHQD
jgi:hypothetical protein